MKFPLLKSLSVTLKRILKTEEKKPHKKDRLRDKKNKGKPDFAAKRAKKAAALKAKEQV